MITLEPKTHGGTTVPNGKRGTESGHMLKKNDIYFMVFIYFERHANRVFCKILLGSVGE